MEIPPEGRLCPSAGWEEQLWNPVWNAELR